ncbi:MAG: DUF2225 domain-containing protein [Spirochaetaceae bacterium]|jgi:uncharacterized protein (DUF2225 family)|nr:DUF2225 domain-containing protein [Spirochaetaceae bacterium]
MAKIKKQEAKESGPLKVSFFSKEEISCPVCTEKFRREELLTGGGRQIAGGLTDDLHRLYETSSKYGDSYPLIYQVTVCPKCWFAAMAEDFLQLPGNQYDTAISDEKKRKLDVQLIFPAVNFNEPRTLFSGVVAHYLALWCYHYFTPEFSPTIKSGITALRASWLLDEINKKQPGQHWDWVSVLFKKKARFFYTHAVKMETSGKEPLAGINLGPDTDKNYGYEGVLYLAAYLEYHYGEHNDPALRVKSIDELGRNVAKMFGMGKSSKGKPGPLLERARSLYDLIKTETNEFDG